MATQTASPSDFIKNLGRMYGTYTGGFLAFIILLAILEQVGVPNKILGYLFVFFTLAVYAVIGVMTRTAEVSEYYVAGRRVPAFYNGMATGADWMSAASFVGMAGTLFLLLEQHGELIVGNETHVDQNLTDATQCHDLLDSFAACFS